MIIDDKKRVIGKIISINSDRFSVELLSGTRNFNVNGFDDIHYFAQINSYVIVPYQNYYIVSEVISVREKDEKTSEDIKEQELNKSHSVKYIDVLPIGRITGDKFDFGVSVYPTLYSDVLYIKDSELDIIFDVKNFEVSKCERCDSGNCKDKLHKTLAYKNKTALASLEIGRSAIFPDYKVKMSVDKFFGSHSAVLGNTGSGKSCTISSMLQTLLKKENFSAVGATFFIFDVNGEYRNAFENIPNKDIKITNLSIEKKNGYTQFKLPHHFFNLEEWEILLQASEKTQRPILRSALGISTLFSKKDTAVIKATKNHILATCITLIMRDESSSPSKKDRIISILRKFNTDDILLKKKFSNTQLSYDSGRKTADATIENALFLHFGEMIGTEELHDYLESKNPDGSSKFFTDNFSMPSYDKEAEFDFNEIENALELALLYEEAHGNRHIRDYCSSLMTRFKSIKERTDFDFIKEKSVVSKETYMEALLSVGSKKKISQIIILDLNSVEDELIEIVSCVLTRMIFEKLRNLNNRNTFPVNLVLEEAHRYISNESQRNFLKENHIFERVAKEGRKYGLFFLISSQRPSELSRTVLSQCNNFIVHRIQNPDDLSHIRQITPHISESTLKKLPSIPTQHALIFGGAVNIPTLFKVNNADPLPNSDNNKVSENWFIPKDQEINF